MKEPRFLKPIPPTKQENHLADHSDPPVRLKEVVLNLTESASDCLNRISQLETQKDSPSTTLMEDYFLLQNYLDFLKRLCQRESL